jgi:hypothetical protein
MSAAHDEVETTKSFKLITPFKEIEVGFDFVHFLSSLTLILYEILNNKLIFVKQNAFNINIIFKRISGLLFAIVL